MTAAHISTATEEKTQVFKPRQYAVVMLNDDFTPMDFVVMILENIFGLDEASATRLMLEVHYKGRGVAGVYTKEVAETKAFLANQTAAQEEHPFRCEVVPV